MLTALVALHTILNTAYTLFCFILGFWALIVTVRNQPIPGGFWGALVTNEGLAIAILIMTLLLQAGGLPPARGWLYYLYLLFFVIVLPGTFALLRGRDDRTAAAIYTGIILFTALTALTRSELLTHYAAQMAQSSTAVPGP